ncbi:MAG: redoxin domain-containing protein [Pseudomonadales bacterium]|jgi:peroxiredoxin|tara:strand:+ start:2834 stop:3397 length:564 start_codon:yes stop_codon:yes gene_type:complete
MNKLNRYPMAPEFETSTWINTSKALTLAQLKGKVVVLHAFQMLCPGCVSHGLPQAKAIHEMFSNDDVQVIGLHTVFEHHKVMTVEALQAFVSEYRLSFPIAMDLPDDVGPIPKTMGKYSMQGTPTLIIIDRQGAIRLNYFGSLHDMQVGKIIGSLLSEVASQALVEPTSTTALAGEGLTCDDDGCRI